MAVSLLQASDEGRKPNVTYCSKKLSDFTSARTRQETELRMICVFLSDAFALRPFRPVVKGK
jgi:hypothetical protein